MNLNKAINKLNICINSYFFLRKLKMIFLFSLKRNSKIDFYCYSYKKEEERKTEIRKQTNRNIYKGACIYKYINTKI